MGCGHIRHVTTSCLTDGINCIRVVYCVDCTHTWSILMENIFSIPNCEPDQCLNLDQISPGFIRRMRLTKP